MENIITLRWYCGHYKGPAYWHRGGRDWTFEPDECCEEFETQHTGEEIDEQMISATCPGCGAHLTLEDDEPVKD